MTVIEVRYPVSRVFTKTRKAWEQHPRFISSCGGTRSGKTFSILQLLWRQSSKDTEPTITSVVSETMPHLKRGAIRDFKSILGEYFDEDCWNKTDCIYTFPNGSIIEFFSADSSAKVHGPARDRLFINEAQNVSYDIARQLFVRTRGQIIIDYNPTHSFWLNEKIESQQNCICVHSTYEDNKRFLTPEQIAEIESNRSDKNWWRVYGEGKVGTLDGLIYEFDTIDSLPPKGLDKPQSEKTEEELYADSLTEIAGIDFGFSNDPTAIVRVYADHKRKEAYIQELCYRTHLFNRDIAAELGRNGIGRNTEVFADCAEPKSIAEIAESGFRVTACDKDAPVKSDKLKFQLQWMQGWKLHVTKDSLNLINELRNYTWAKDKDGNALNEPIDKFNHSLDALRYALWSKYGLNAGEGEYRISFSHKRR